MELKIEYLPTDDLRTYANNAKVHTAEQVEQIKKSIEQFGFNDPIAIWQGNEIIEGHGRLIAAKELGIERVPVIRLDRLTDEQRRAYMLIHNKLTMNTDFDMDVLQEELEALEKINMSDFGFEELFEDPTDYDDDDDEPSGVIDHSKDKGDEFGVYVMCVSEREMLDTYAELTRQGYTCRTY